MRATQLRQDVTASTLAGLADRMADLQADDGSVRPEATDRAGELLRTALESVHVLAARIDAGEVADAIAADVTNWLRRGVIAAPQFDRTVEAVGRRAAGAAKSHMFWGPCRTPNGIRGQRWAFEAFLAVDHAPPPLRALRRLYPHPGALCRPVRTIAASSGFAEGNCVVFFPENVAVAQPIERQGFSLFFFDKWPGIYRSETLRTAATVLDDASRCRLVSSAARAADMYDARCTWGHMHDYFHHSGPRPLHMNLQAKCTWHAGVLEELKVDAEVAMAALAGELPHPNLLAEMVLLERLFRYPTSAAPMRSFDAATGVLLFEWLRRHDALAMKGTTVVLRWESISSALQKFVAEVESLERKATASESLPEAARRMLGTLLPSGPTGARFGYPDDYPPGLKSDGATGTATS